MSTDNTVPKQLTPFKPGQSGNPKGRPKGSRNKITEDFLRDLHDVWQEHGKAALITTATQEPAKFVSVTAGLVPKESLVTIDDKRDATDWTRDELVRFIAEARTGGSGTSEADGRSGEPDSVH